MFKLFSQLKNNNESHCAIIAFVNVHTLYCIHCIEPLDHYSFLFNSVFHMPVIAYQRLGNGS